MAEAASQIRTAIAMDREHLAETVQALAHKADVKGRVKDKVADSADQVRGKAEEVADHAMDAAHVTAQHVSSRKLPYALAGLVVAALLLRRLLHHSE